MYSEKIDTIFEQICTGSKIATDSRKKVVKKSVLPISDVEL